MDVLYLTPSNHVSVTTEEILRRGHNWFDTTCSMSLDTDRDGTRWVMVASDTFAIDPNMEINHFATQVLCRGSKIYGLEEQIVMGPVVLRRFQNGRQQPATMDDWSRLWSASTP